MAPIRQSVNLVGKTAFSLSKRYKTTSFKLVYSDYGDPSSVIRLEREDLDSPGPGKVLVKMLAAPINPADINTIQGVYPIKPPLPSIPGNEGVGKVTEVGEGVKSLKVGDLVLPRENAWGTWRTHALATSDELLKISSGVGVVAAATMSVNPCTAYRMLKDFVQLKEGDVIIQNGANSACGQSVIQFCKAWNIKTVNIVRNRTDLETLKKQLKDLGADYIIAEDEVTTTKIFKDGVPKPKLALNCVGGKNALEMMRHLDKKGTMVTYGGMSREPVTVPTSTLIFKDIRLKGFWMTRWNMENAGTADQAVMFSEIANFSKSGKWQPPAHQMMPLANFKDVLQRAMDISGKTGKKFIFDLNEFTSGSNQFTAPVKTAKTQRETKPVLEAKHGQDPKPVQEAKPVQDTKPAQDIKPVKDTNPVKGTRESMDINEP